MLEQVQQRASKLIKDLEYLIYKLKLREWGLFNPAYTRLEASCYV